MEGKSKKVTRRTGIGTGTTSLLVIFTLLSMATLALLSLTTAISNKKITERSFISTQNMALAKGESEEKVARIDQLLYTAYKNGANEKEYFISAIDLLQEDGFTVDTDKEKVIFTIPVDERHSLVTEIQLLYPGANNARYRIESNASVLTTDWQPEAGGNYWSGT